MAIASRAANRHVLSPAYTDLLAQKRDVPCPMSAILTERLKRELPRPRAARPVWNGSLLTGPLDPLRSHLQEPFCRLRSADPSIASS
jgi:hypothetical protein